MEKTSSDKYTIENNKYKRKIEADSKPLMCKTQSHIVCELDDLTTSINEVNYVFLSSYL